MRYLLVAKNTDLLKKYIVQDDDTSIQIHPNYQVLLRILGYEITGNIDSIIVIKKPLL